MSPLDCVVYLADSLEPGRTFRSAPTLWALAMNDLDAGDARRAALDDGAFVRKGARPAPRSWLRPRASG